MTTWAWSVHRIIDALDLTLPTQIDSRRVCVTGCSRNGKDAIVAGAIEDSIALSIPQEGRQGGVGPNEVIVTTCFGNTFAEDIFAGSSTRAAVGQEAPKHA
ncbi:uncharacterized protein BDR25DRAFT_308408 [Lindgomyces ingoldianus]|uniref:Uncharacterized protein n=1 Tax=Lindgomyces ingoldianus TaxID=673940 RepID=A0ACB6RG87_9PLEO|nr:uncharacterized protein BDR25DRAFT_308408 [Lindgomyces ingoldianus]KAF2477486.1 hypothetical protein BDR25DRAFT_308408 [Lindgomyces ingoldianus]